MEKEKEKGKSPPSAGPNPAQPSLSCAPTLPPRGPRGPSPHAHPCSSIRRCQPGPTRQSRSPSLPRNRPLSGKLVSPFLAPVTKLSMQSPSAATRSIASPLTRSRARFGALHHRALCPNCPFSPPARAIPSPPLCAIIAAMASSSVLATLPPFPALGAYKRTARAPSFLTLVSATPSPLP
jgi:hypothetical protein